MDILAVNKYFWPKGGSESVFFNEMAMLESAGHLVIPFSMRSASNIETIYSKYFVSEVNYSNSGLVNRLSSAAKIIFSFESRNKMKDLLAENSVDIAHFHIFQHQISPSVFGPIKSRNIPIILTLHDLKPICPNYKMYVNGRVCEDCKGAKFYKCFINRCTKGSALGSLVNSVEMYFHYAMGYYQNVDHYISVSQFYRSKMIEFGFNPENITYLPNFIDTGLYNTSAVDKGYILYIGRLSEEKGIETLIQAAKLLPDIPIYIVGSGPLESQFKQQAEFLGVSHMLFLGYKTGDQLKQIISESTAVVVPSQWYENCPMAILESFASCKPVIGADIGGIPELINSTVDGFTFTPGDADALAERISWIWENRSAARDMGFAGREKVRVRFNSEVHYDGLMSIYNSVLAT